MIQQRARQDAARATQSQSEIQLRPISKTVAGKVNSWEDIANLTDAELAALFKEWGLMSDDGLTMTGDQLKAMWSREARAQGVPKSEIDKILGQSGGMWSQMAGQINGAAIGVGDPNAVMGSLFRQEYANTCKCSPQAFADALGRAETRLGGQLQGAMAKALGGQRIPISALPSPPVVTYNTGDQPVLVAQAIINQGQAQVAVNTPPPAARPPAAAPIAPPPAPAPIAPPPAAAPIAPPPAAAPIAPPPAAAPIAPPPAAAPIAPPPAAAPIAPPPAAAPIAPPPAAAPIAPPPAAAPIAPPPAAAPIAPPPPAAPSASPVMPPAGGGAQGTSPLLDMTLPHAPELNVPTAEPLGPDTTPAEKSEPVGMVPEIKPRPVPKVAEAPRCKSQECFQKQLDLLAIERKIIAQNQRSQPMIQALDTLGNIVIGVSPFAGPGTPALVVIGGTLKGLKVLVTAGNEAKNTRIKGGNQTDALGTFVTTTAVEGGTEVVKEIVGQGLGKFIPEGSSEVVTASGELLISVVVDEAPTVGAGVVDVAFGGGHKVAADTKAFVGDVGRVVTGGRF